MNLNRNDALGRETERSLQRYVDAQRDIYTSALEELSRGRKAGHWMWYVFPQLAGLGKSQTSTWFAIQGLAEAAAYLRHPVLGARLRESAGVLLLHQGVSAAAIFGSPDDMKLRSCLTLFSAIAQDDYDRELFDAVLQAFFSGERDPLTLDLIRASRTRSRDSGDPPHI